MLWYPIVHRTTVNRADVFLDGVCKLFSEKFPHGVSTSLVASALVEIGAFGDEGVTTALGGRDGSRSGLDAWALLAVEAVPRPASHFREGVFAVEIGLTADTGGNVRLIPRHRAFRIDALTYVLHEEGDARNPSVTALLDGALSSTASGRCFETFLGISAVR